MEELTNHKSYFDRISLSEGSTFESDEASIIKEFQIQEENKSSIAIKILSIFGGFMASIFFISFLLAIGLYNSEMGLFITGCIFIVASIWLNKQFNKLIIDTFSVSIYISGGLLFSYGLLEMDIEANTLMLAIITIAIISLILTQNYILSFISMLTINGSIFFLIISNELYNFIHIYIAISTLMLAYLMLNEPRLIASHKILSKLYNPGRIALILSLLSGLIILRNSHFIGLDKEYIWLCSIVTILVMLYLVYRILQITKIKNLTSKILIYALSCLILIPTFYAPSISGALLIILLSFLVNYKTGLSIGILAFVYFISQYYYDLHFTLLTKSIILFSTGVIFLLFYLFTLKKPRTNEKI